jgi:hypothetical protein
LSSDFVRHSPNLPKKIVFHSDRRSQVETVVFLTWLGTRFDIIEECKRAHGQSPDSYKARLEQHDELDRRIKEL